MKKLIIETCFECPHIHMVNYRKEYKCKSSDRTIRDPWIIGGICPLKDATEKEESESRATWYSSHYGV